VCRGVDTSERYYRINQESSWGVCAGIWHQFRPSFRPSSPILGHGILTRPQTLEPCGIGSMAACINNERLHRIRSTSNRRRCSTVGSNQTRQFGRVASRSHCDIIARERGASCLYCIRSSRNKRQCSCASSSLTTGCRHGQKISTGLWPLDRRCCFFGIQVSGSQMMGCR
jgi:hypothetical protein